MSSSSLIRWSGLGLLLAGLFLVLQQVFALASPDPTGIGWVAVHTLGYFGLVFGLLGLVGAHSVQRDRISRAGTIGFILAFIGNGLTAGAAFLNTYIVPVLSTEAPDLLGAGPSDPGPLFGGPMGMVLLLAGLLVTPGFILFGIATVRAGVLPKWAAWVVVLTSWFGLTASFSPELFGISGALFGLGSAGLGYGVWSGASEAAGRPKAAARSA